MHINIIIIIESEKNVYIEDIMCVYGMIGRKLNMYSACFHTLCIVHRRPCTQNSIQWNKKLFIIHFNAHIVSKKDWTKKNNISSFFLIVIISINTKNFFLYQHQREGEHKIYVYLLCSKKKKRTSNNFKGKIDKLTLCFCLLLLLRSNECLMWIVDTKINIELYRFYFLN